MNHYPTPPIRLDYFTILILIGIGVVVDREGLVGFVQDNGDHVDAAGDVAAFKIDGGHAFDAVVFSGSEHGFGRTEIQTNLGFDFDENQYVFVLGGDIDFAEAGVEIGGDYLIALFD